MCEPLSQWRRVRGLMARHGANWSCLKMCETSGRDSGSSTESASLGSDALDSVLSLGLQAPVTPAGAFSCERQSTFFAQRLLRIVPLPHKIAHQSAMRRDGDA